MANLLRITLAFFALFVVASGEEDIMKTISDASAKAGSCICGTFNWFNGLVDTCRIKSQNFPGEVPRLIPLDDTTCMPDIILGPETAKCTLKLLENNQGLKDLVSECIFPALDMDIATSFPAYGWCVMNVIDRVCRGVSKQ